MLQVEVEPLILRLLPNLDYGVFLLGIPLASADAHTKLLPVKMGTRVGIGWPTIGVKAWGSDGS